MTSIRIDEHNIYIKQAVTHHTYNEKQFWDGKINVFLCGITESNTIKEYKSIVFYKTMICGYSADNYIHTIKLYMKYIEPLSIQFETQEDYDAACKCLREHFAA